MQNTDKKLCESIQKMIFSDEILTDEQLNHVNSCECCSKLLLQKNIMLNDLAELDLIEDKQAFAENVVGKIKDIQNKSKGHIRFSRYAATAAAAVLVFACLFVLGDKTPILDNNDGAQPVILKNTITAYDDTTDSAQSIETDSGIYNDYEYTGEISTEESPAALEKEFADNTPQEARVMFKMARPEAENEKMAVENERIQEEDLNVNNSAVMDLSENDDAMFFSAKTTGMEEGAKENAAITNAASGGGGGGSGAQSYAVEDAADECVYDEADACEEEYLPFGDVEFLEGEENIGYNLSLLQQKLDELYGEKYTVDAAAFKNSGLDNSVFTEKLSNMTLDEFLYFIKSSTTFVFEK